MSELKNYVALFTSLVLFTFSLKMSYRIICETMQLGCPKRVLRLAFVQGFIGHKTNGPHCA